MQHFAQYPHRMVPPYSVPQHAPGHRLQLQERTHPPPLIPFQTQMGEHVRLQAYAPGHLQVQRHPVPLQMQSQGQSQQFQERMIQMNVHGKPQLMPRMPVQMQYPPTYYSVPNRFPSSVSPNSGRERPLSDPSSMNVPGLHPFRMGNVHGENFERYPRSYSEPHEDPNRLNPDLYQQEVYRDSSYRPETYQREPNVNTNEIFYRAVPVGGDRPMEMFQTKSSLAERHMPEKQSVLQKELERPSHGISSLESNKVITKREYEEPIDEAQDGNIEDNEFVDFEEAANLNVYSEQHERQTQEEGGENYDDNISIEHFLQVDYSDNANNQSNQQEEQQVQRQGQPLYQMNRQKTIIFKCKYCKKKFFHKRELEKHMISHSTYTRVRNDGKKRDFPCTLCDCSYIRKTHLERHMLSHMRKQDQYKCAKCNYFFVHRRHLEIHNLQVHSGKSADEGEVDDGGYDEQVQIVSVDPNAPDFSNEPQVSIVKIKEEIIDMAPSRPNHKHSNIKRSFFCQHCGRAFLKNQYLRAHIRNFHDGNFSETAVVEMTQRDSPFVQKKNMFCPVCGQGFIKMKYFRSHWNKFHEQEHETRIEVGKKTNPVPLNAPPPPQVKKPFVCHICNNGFYHPQNLKRHIRDVHYKKKPENAENQAVVTDNQNVSTQSKDRSKAVKKVAPAAKKPLQRARGPGAFCPVCSKEFLYEYNVRRHIRNSHPAFIGLAPVKTKPVPMALEDEQEERQEDQDQSITLSSLSSSNINESQLMGWNMDDDGQPSTSQSGEERPYKCTLCDKKFYRLLFLKRHCEVSHGVLHPDTTDDDWSFECQSCGKRFARNDSLIRHMKFKHKKLYRTMRAEKIRQNYETANKAQQENATEEPSLEEPKNNEEKETPVDEGTEVSQEIETDPFGDVPAPEVPETPAPKLKIFRCTKCNNSFCTKLEFIKHQRTMHPAVRQRKYKCKICNFKFSQHAHLRRHITQVHSKQNAGGTKKCTKCEFTAGNNIALSNHMRAHTREEANMRFHMIEEAQDEMENPREEEVENQPEDVDSQLEEEMETQLEETDSQPEELEEESQPEEDLDSREENIVTQHEIQQPVVVIDRMEEGETSSQDEDTIEPQAEEEIEDQTENVSDNLAETFNESLAKRLDETLAETMMSEMEEILDE
uniref:Zinc finger protein Xfin n=1 Tax=Cacopsylla melanoneura TaxID=428564 RepID=A0A8D8TD78_9HEMI